MKTPSLHILCFLLVFHRIKYSLQQSPPQLTVKNGTRQEIVKPFVSITLECPVRNSKELIIEWYKDKEDILFFSSSRIRILSNGSLRIKETLFDDTGVYRCRAVNGFGSVEYFITLLVIGTEEDYEQYDGFSSDDVDLDTEKIGLSSKPQILYVNENASSIYKTPGTTFMLQCVATGHPKPDMMWFKDGNPVSHHFRIGRWTLKFAKATLTDSANYTCVAKNQFGLDTHSFILVIDEHGRKYRGKPLITGSNVTVEEGEKAIMECGVESVSIPHIEWLKQVTFDSDNPKPDNHAITMEGEYFSVLTNPFSIDYRLKDDIYFHKLIIEHVQLEDAGKYVCLGANTFGYEYQFTYLDVIPRLKHVHSPLPFPVLVTMVVIALSILGCIMTFLLYCRPRRETRTTDISVAVPMVTKNDFIPMHAGPSRALKCAIQPNKKGLQHHVTYVADVTLTNGIV